MTDIDLWVLKKDYPTVTGILKERGYEPDFLYPNTFRRGSTAFDLHTHILWADRIKARRLLLEGVTIDFAETPTSSGFVFIDPKASSCGCSTEEPAESLAS